MSILRFQISKMLSLEIDSTKWSGEVSEELGNTDGVDLSCLVNIIIFPGIIVSKSKEFLSVFSALGEMGAENLCRSFSSRVFSQIKFTSWLWVSSFSFNSFNCVFGKHILSEFINWIRINSNITGESFWDGSWIWLHEISVLVLSSWESIQMWTPSIEWFEVFKDFFSRSLEETLFKKFVLIWHESHSLGWRCNYC